MAAERLIRISDSSFWVLNGFASAQAMMMYINLQIVSFVHRLIQVNP
jgi:hypothetical protein